MRAVLFGATLALLCASAPEAQVFTAPAAANVDLSAYALTSAVPALAPVQSVNGLTGAVTGMATAGDIPAASNLNPNGDGTTPVIGASALYARADHTHPTRVFSQRVTVSGSTATWTFATPFSVTPAITYAAESADTTYPVICNISAISTTAVTVRCFKGAAVSVAILGVNVNAFLGSVNGTVVDMTARVPTG